jgi:catechol 2,3-dioxygenase-like lactoylglutathione lyase family enzyme
MEVTRLGYVGTRTARAAELAVFYERVLGLRLVYTAQDLWVFELPDGTHVEVFGEAAPKKDHFLTGPVVGFAVADLPAAVEEMQSMGVELLGQSGPTWQHFRGPDGNVYELSSASVTDPEQRYPGQ